MNFDYTPQEEWHFINQKINTGFCLQCKAAFTLLDGNYNRYELWEECSFPLLIAIPSETIMIIYSSKYLQWIFQDLKWISDNEIPYSIVKEDIVYYLSQPIS